MILIFNEQCVTIFDCGQSDYFAAPVRNSQDVEQREIACEPCQNLHRHDERDHAAADGQVEAVRADWHWSESLVLSADDKFSAARCGSGRAGAAAAHTAAGTQAAATAACQFQGLQDHQTRTVERIDGVRDFLKGAHWQFVYH